MRYEKPSYGTPRSPMSSMGISFNVARHDQFSGHRVSITAVTSSWSDGTAGPLGLCVPRGMMTHEEIQSFNSEHTGRCFVFSSERRTHYMCGETFLVLLNGLITDAFAIQRAKYNLSESIRGLLLTDAWSGFFSWTSGLDVAREAWSSAVNTTLPDLQAGGWSASCQPVDQIHSILRSKLDVVDASDAGCIPDLRSRRNILQHTHMTWDCNCILF